MIVRAISPAEFFSVFPVAGNVYGSKAFFDVTPVNETIVRLFVGYDDRMNPLVGMVAGYRNGEWYAPYSAPFTDVLSTKTPGIETYYDFFTELTGALDAPLHITLPPDIYYHGTGAALNGVLGNLARKCVFDYDYYFPTELFSRYGDMLSHAGRKNLARAEKSDLSFELTNDIDRVYGIILVNRESHGYRLAMSLQQVRNTTAVVETDFFILSRGADDVAAAMVYHVAEGVVQVIYWGDAPGYSEMRPMNLLACKVFEYYADRGVAIVDVGPSSTNGIPNTGLCRFKESVGCRVILKPTYLL